MKLKSLIIAVTFSIFLTYPSYAGTVAPEIPSGFGPIFISGIALAVAAIKNIKEKK